MSRQLVELNGCPRPLQRKSFHYLSLVIAFICLFGQAALNKTQIAFLNLHLWHEWDIRLLLKRRICVLLVLPHRSETGPLRTEDTRCMAEKPREK